jgi:HEAT repeat protein
MRFIRISHLTTLLFCSYLLLGRACLGFPQTKTEPLIQSLSDADPTVRGEALRRLESMPKEQVVPPVLAALEKADRDTAQRLLKVLEEFPDLSEIGPLIRLAKREPGLGTELFSLLGEPGAQVILSQIPQRCTETIEHESFAEWAGIAVARMGGAARLALKKAIDDPNPCVRIASLWGLGLSDDESLDPQLNKANVERDVAAVVQRLGDSDAKVRDLAAEALTPSREIYPGWAMLQGEAVQPLTEFFHSQTERESRLLAIRLLSLYTCQALMEEAKKDPDPRVREIAEHYQPPEESDEGSPAEVALDARASEPNRVQKLMYSKLPADRAKAAEEFSKTVDAGSTQHLILLLKDDSPLVREKAAEGLGNQNEPIEEAGPHPEPDVADAGPALFEALLDSQIGVRVTAARALAQIYPASAHSSADPREISADHQQFLSRLEPLASISDQAVARAGAFALAHFLDPSDLQEAIALAHHASPEVREEAAEAVARAQKPESVPPLIALFKDPKDAVRGKAAQYLYSMIVFAAADKRPGLTEQLPLDPLLDALKDPATQWSVVGLFEFKKDRRAVEPVLALLPKASSSSAAQILRTVVQIGDKRAAKLLLDHLKNDSDPNRYAILKAIIDLHNEEIEEPLLAFARTPTGAWLDRESVLLSFHDARVIPELLEQLKDAHEHVRVKAANDLSNFKDQRIPPALMDALKDEAWDVQYAAAKSLGQIGDRRAVPALVAMLEYNPGAAAMALGKLQASETLPKLAELAQQKTTKNRSEVIAGIGEFPAEQAVAPLVAAMKAASKNDCEFLVAVTNELGHFETESATAGLRELYFKAWPSDACPEASRLAAQLLTRRGAGPQSQ